MSKKIYIINIFLTFMNAGQFHGSGERVLGIRFPKDNQYQHGWVILNFAIGREIRSPYSISYGFMKIISLQVFK